MSIACVFHRPMDYCISFLETAGETYHHDCLVRVSFLFVYLRSVNRVYLFCSVGGKILLIFRHHANQLNNIMKQKYKIVVIIP